MSSEEALHASALRSFVSQVKHGTASAVSSQIRKDQRKKLVQQLENMEDSNTFQSSVNDVSFSSMQYDQAFNSYDENSRNISNDNQRSARFNGKKYYYSLTHLLTYSLTHSLTSSCVCLTHCFA